MANTTTNPTSESENLKELKTKLRSKFPYLTEADLNYDVNKRDIMLTRIQIKLGKTRDELDEVIESL